MKTSQTLQHAIAITGAIASGKSTASKIFELLGYRVICADYIAHRVLEQNAKEIINAFGAQIANQNPPNPQTDANPDINLALNPPANQASQEPQPTINRKELGKIVFADERKRKLLESILHPKIHAQILSKALELESSHQWYFLDIPLFFESGGRERYPVRYVLTIATDERTQLERVMKRDALKPCEIEQRINAQMPLQEKINASDFVIHNGGTLQDLQHKIEEFLAMIGDCDTGNK